jgi:methionyl aminopeptidase
MGSGGIMRRRRELAIEIKTPAQLAAMWEAGQVVAAALRAAAAAAVPGTTTADLDAIAAAELRAAGAAPSFLNYHGFPATICTSVNDEIVHGIPSRSRVLREGDVLSVDCGAIVGGWHADAALTVPVGAVAPEVSALLLACERAMWAGIGAIRPGARLSDISHAVQRAAAGYGIVEDYAGHGIGSQMHMDPPVPNMGRPGRGPLLRQGMALAIEPLLVLGSPATDLLGDGWTVVSEDGSLSAHFEHTVAVTAAGPWVLTEPAADRAGGDRAGGDRAGGDRAGGDRAGGDRAGAAVGAANGHGAAGQPGLAGQLGLIEH